MQGTDHREIGGLLLDIGKAGGSRIKRIIYPPGFRWSTHMKPVVKTELCMHAHAGFLAQGQIHVQYEDGDTVELAAPQFVSVEPGHDAWVVGDEPCVIVEMTGSSPATTQVVACPCGVSFRIDNDDALEHLVAAVQEHARGSHDHAVTREHVLAEVTSV